MFCASLSLSGQTILKGLALVLMCSFWLKIAAEKLTSNFGYN